MFVSSFDIIGIGKRAVLYRECNGQRRVEKLGNITVGPVMSEFIEKLIDGAVGGRMVLRRNRIVRE